MWGWKPKIPKISIPNPIDAAKKEAERLKRIAEENARKLAEATRLAELERLAREATEAAEKLARETAERIKREAEAAERLAKETAERIKREAEEAARQAW